MSEDASTRTPRPGDKGSVRESYAEILSMGQTYTVRYLDGSEEEIPPREFEEVWRAKDGPEKRG